MSRSICAVSRDLQQIRSTLGSSSVIFSCLSIKFYDSPFFRKPKPFGFASLRHRVQRVPVVILHLSAQKLFCPRLFKEGYNNWKMDYELFHDESNIAGYWHGILLVPVEKKTNLVNLLDLSRKESSYKESLSIKKVKKKRSYLRMCLFLCNYRSCFFRIKF